MEQEEHKGQPPSLLPLSMPTDNSDTASQIQTTSSQAGIPGTGIVRLLILSSQMTSVDIYAPLLKLFTSTAKKSRAVMQEQTTKLNNYTDFYYVLITIPSQTVLRLPSQQAMLEVLGPHLSVAQLFHCYMEPLAMGLMFQTRDYYLRTSLNRVMQLFIANLFPLDRASTETYKLRITPGIIPTCYNRISRLLTDTIPRLINNQTTTNQYWNYSETLVKIDICYSNDLTRYTVELEKAMIAAANLYFTSDGDTPFEMITSFIALLRNRDRSILKAFLKNNSLDDQLFKIFNALLLPCHQTMVNTESKYAHLHAAFSNENSERCYQLITSCCRTWKPIFIDAHLANNSGGPIELTAPHAWFYIKKQLPKLMEAEVMDISIYADKFLLTILQVAEWFKAIILHDPQQAQTLSNNCALLLCGMAATGKSMLTRVLSGIIEAEQWTMGSYQRPSIATAALITCEELDYRAMSSHSSLLKQLLDFNAAVSVDVKYAHPVICGSQVPVIFTTNHCPYKFYNDLGSHQTKTGVSMSSAEADGIFRKFKIIYTHDKWTTLHAIPPTVSGITQILDDLEDPIEKTIRLSIQESQLTIATFLKDQASTDQQKFSMFNFFLAYALFSDKTLTPQLTTLLGIDTELSESYSFITRLFASFRKTLFGSYYLTNGHTYQKIITQLNLCGQLGQTGQELKKVPTAEIVNIEHTQFANYFAKQLFSHGSKLFAKKMIPQGVETEYETTWLSTLLTLQVAPYAKRYLLTAKIQAELLADIKAESINDCLPYLHPTWSNAIKKQMEERLLCDEQLSGEEYEEISNPDMLEMGDEFEQEEEKTTHCNLHIEDNRVVQIKVATPVKKSPKESPFRNVPEQSVIQIQDLHQLSLHSAFDPNMLNVEGMKPMVSLEAPAGIPSTRISIPNLLGKRGRDAREEEEEVTPGNFDLDKDEEQARMEQADLRELDGNFKRTRLI